MTDGPLPLLSAVQLLLMLVPAVAAVFAAMLALHGAGGGRSRPTSAPHHAGAAP
ncbi:hypothetical protein KPL78_07225 [Roseomonas sp. HJA6]|uniref:Uncharacterized protein n=1 Tax=Roseomonas alba TaxID=2846776 RepID=A0ABS7A5P8_9PROT|nr:hypothetical protein [Neoroseomonas alba]MBW6397629.1 hypothetical protein [Neoroseomonas alba]